MAASIVVNRLSGLFCLEQQTRVELTPLHTTHPTPQRTFAASLCSAAPPRHSLSVSLKCCVMGLLLLVNCVLLVQRAHTHTQGKSERDGTDPMHGRHSITLRSLPWIIGSLSSLCSKLAKRRF